MTRAAFQAAFADFKLIKGRKVAQFVFEVPTEGSDAALLALGGVPKPDKECWAAIARIDPTKAVRLAPEPASAPAKERRSWNELPPSQQAAIRCGEEAFVKFIAEQGYVCVDAKDAAYRIREICEVSSRSEIIVGSPAEKRWQFLESSYQAWLRDPYVEEPA